MMHFLIGVGIGILLLIAGVPPLAIMFLGFGTYFVADTLMK